MAHLKKMLLALACFALPFVSYSASANDFLNTKSFLKDVVAGNPGNELVIPYIVEVDANEDLYPEKIKFRLRIYPNDSATRLFQTPLRSYFPPALPCANPINPDWSWEPEFFGDNNTHTGVAVSFQSDCDEAGVGYQSVEGSFVYVADTTAPGSGWSKSWDQPIVSADFVDWDDDQQDEVKIVLLAPSSGGKINLQVVIADKITGAIEFNEKYLGIQVIGN